MRDSRLVGLPPIVGANLAVNLDGNHDGDTAAADIAGWHPIVGHRMPIRLFGVDAAELDDPRPDVRAKAFAAKAMLAELTDRRDVVLPDLRRDMYFRLLATMVAGGVDVIAEMLKAGLVRPYSGHGPKPW